MQAVVHIARKLAAEGKSYRIITPYDAQRGAIEDALKNAGLAWEDKCFNVDSFQGEVAVDSHTFLLPASADSSFTSGRQRGRLHYTVSRTLGKSWFPKEPTAVECYALALQEKYDHLY